MPRRANNVITEPLLLTWDQAQVTADTTVKLWTAPRPMKLSRVTYVNPTGLAQHATAFYVLKARKNSTVIADWSTTLTSSVLTKAELDLNPLTTNVETVVRAKVAGNAGNAITLALTADGTGAGQLVESAFPAIVFHYADGVTTVANFETAITASTNLEVKTADGVGTMAVTDDDFVATALAGGADAAGDGTITADTFITLLNPATDADLKFETGDVLSIVLDRAVAATTLPAGRFVIEGRLL